ncbi:hypothetical protein CCP3SC15_2540008 [Gammaproteobacteria bacterium]
MTESLIAAGSVTKTHFVLHPDGECFPASVDIIHDQQKRIEPIKLLTRRRLSDNPVLRLS